MRGQRRKQPRFSVDLSITLRSDSKLWAASAHNVSEGGVFVATRELKPIGAELDLTLRLPPPQGAVAIRGVVRWIGENASDHEVPLGMGIEFEELTPDSRRALRSFLAMNHRPYDSVRCGRSKDVKTWPRS
ncbi:MAG TPA: TIGR02266 family protein [Polyangiaceae bacterium]